MIDFRHEIEDRIDFTHNLVGEVSFRFGKLTSVLITDTNDDFIVDDNGDYGTLYNYE